jgi:hypothetical protein
MFKYMIAAIAVSGMLAAGPTLAAEGKAKSDQPAAMDQQPVPSNPQQRYCYNVQPSTGSIVSGRICKTLKQWRAEGVDPTKAQRN